MAILLYLQYIENLGRAMFMFCSFSLSLHEFITRKSSDSLEIFTKSPNENHQFKRAIYGIFCRVYQNANIQLLWIDAESYDMAQV